jgi:hypothetical protein
MCSNLSIFFRDWLNLMRDKWLAVGYVILLTKEAFGEHGVSNIYQSKQHLPIHLFSLVLDLLE